MKLVCAALLGVLVSSAALAVEAPMANVTGGTIRGVVEGGQAVFKSIPYEAAVTGANRWRAPQAVTPWSGTRDATQFGPACPQDDQYVTRAEDCATLNVWSPEGPSSAPKAVMVWFHGGGNVEGSANNAFYYGAGLARHGVVVVTVQYRLGIFGFFAHPELTAESAHHASGNYGLLDQIAALKWVKANIASFGGDPANVTIFGQSAGAEDVGLLMVSPLARGLFQRAIAESGPLRRLYPALAEAEADCAAMTASLKPPAKNQIAFLRTLGWNALLRNQLESPGRCRPINLDGHVLTEQPLKTYAEGHETQVPFILGSTLREGNGPGSLDAMKGSVAQTYGEMAPRVLAAYGVAEDAHYGSAPLAYTTDQNHRCRIQLTGLQHVAAGVHFYQFEFRREYPRARNTQSTHMLELPYLFGADTLKLAIGTAPAIDRTLSDQMGRYWTNFAKTGNPNAAGLPVWPQFDAAKKAYMAFGDDGAAAATNLRGAQCTLLLEKEKAHPTWRP